MATFQLQRVITTGTPLNTTRKWYLPFSSTKSNGDQYALIILALLTIVSRFCQQNHVYIHLERWNYSSMPNFNGGLTAPPLELGHGWVITSHSKKTIDVIINPRPTLSRSLSSKEVPCVLSQIARFMGATWGPPGSCRPQIGPVLAPWTLLLSGMGIINPIR